MRNIRLEIEYDGTNYYGWQIQRHNVTPSTSLRAGKPPGHQFKTIQETIEVTLHKILQEDVKLIGSSRTDAGVHARAQVVNFKSNSRIALNKLQESLNSLLPEDIAVIRVSNAPMDFHSRFSAKSKVYQYLILNSKHRSVFFRQRACFCRYPLDLRLMRKEAKALLGRHNFSAFCASAGKLKNQVKTVEKITFSKRDDLITITIKANGFLYNMVRNIVGTLIEIGRGKLPRNSLKRILFSRDRRLAGPTASAKGLTLLKVNF